jgi:hypothetical protein
MGNDGGSIAKRRDLAKDKRREIRADRDLQRTARHNLCTLTQEQLKRPVVACRLGYLLNKTSLIEALLRRNIPAHLAHISNLKDVKQLSLTSNENVEDWMFMCPITKQEMNGNHRFFVMWDCGCVLSEQAIKLSESSCLLCGQPNTFKVCLNMQDEEREVARAALMSAREKRVSRKGEEENKAEALRKRRKLVDTEAL